MALEGGVDGEGRRVVLGQRCPAFVVDAAADNSFLSALADNAIFGVISRHINRAFYRRRDIRECSEAGAS